MSNRTKPDFSEINDWIFDLDNTLYPRHCDLFSQIDRQMTSFVIELTGLEHGEARKLQKDLYFEYGTTLRGLMSTHNIDPHEFLDHAHDIDYSQLPPNPELGEMIGNLPGRKLIYTNGSVSHAQNTLSAIGIEDAFDGIFDIIASDFIPKPMENPFRKFIEVHQIEPIRAAMFEDLPRNLEPAKVAGMTTVLITPQEHAGYSYESWEKASSDAEHIDYQTNDLDTLIEEIVAQFQPKAD